jgi:hypothetical protein
MKVVLLNDSERTGLDDVLAKNGGVVLQEGFVFVVATIPSLDLIYQRRGRQKRGWKRTYQCSIAQSELRVHKLATHILPLEISQGDVVGHFSHHKASEDKRERNGTFLPRVW